MLSLASGVRVSARPRSRSRRGGVWCWARCMRRGTGAADLTVQTPKLTTLSLLLGSLRSLLLVGSLGSLLLLGSLRSLLLLGSLLLLLVSRSLSLLGLLLRRRPLLRSAQPLIWARLRGRSLIRLSSRRCLYSRPLLLRILR